MGIFNFVRDKIKMLFKTDADKAFNVKTYLSSEMETAIQTWKQLEGANGLKPPWCKDDVKTISFSNTVARELASLITQNIDIKVQSAYGTSEKAGFIQSAIDSHFLTNAQEIMERMIRLGGVMAKWNGKGIDYISPDRFLVTDFDSNGKITGCIFFSYYAEGKKFYTRAEYHRTETHNVRNEETGETESVNVYRVSNKAFVSDDVEELGREIPLAKTKWADIEPEAAMENMEKPLFAYIKTPYSNTVDTESPLGVSIFSECIEELRWLDVAMSNMGVETEDSKPIMFVAQSAIDYAINMGIKLPRFLQGLDMGINSNSTIDQWTPTLQVQNRTEGINFLLSIISYKTGFDPGYFVFDGQKITMATATQVEATERRTINTVLTYRNLLDRPNSNGDGRVGFIHDISYIMDTMATANGEFPPGDYGNYELYCDFADLTENEEENKNFAYQLTQNGYMSKARFLVNYMGMTEEEAVAMVEEARAESEAQNKGGLFAEE